MVFVNGMLGVLLTLTELTLEQIQDVIRFKEQAYKITAKFKLADKKKQHWEA